MKKVFKNSSEVVHKFASQSQDEGRCSNVYFFKEKIYSYGSHFCMANIVGPGRVLITSRSYSVTTAKHLSQVRYALNHLKRCYIPYPEQNIKENAERLLNEFADLYNIINNSRKRETTKDTAKVELASLVRNIETYLEWTNQSFKPGKYASESDKLNLTQLEISFTAAKNQVYQISDQIAETVKKHQASQKRKQAKQVKEQKILFDLWLVKGTHPQYNKPVRSNDFYLVDKVGLRVDYDQVETSKGARVSLKAAKVLFDLIQAGKDVKGFVIDGYTVISLNGVLTIGCHNIERSEIERFAKTQNWV